MNVRILATCRREDLLDYTLFVFKSIRVGFPTAEVRVTGNALPDFALPAVEEACSESGCKFENGPETIHHQFIEQLLDQESEPFVLCDTDVCFFRCVEGWEFDTALAGFRVPEWNDEFTGAITRSRLHPSLLFVNPEQVREEVDKYDAQFPVTPFNPPVNLVYPLCVPLNGKTYFSDTLSLMYHAIGGTAFNNQQKDSLFHFNFGTLSDLVLPRLKNGQEMQAAREMILNNSELGRGLWREQEQFYESRQVVIDGKDVIAPVTPEEAKDASHWKNVLCNGNAEAMVFCDVFYGYVHSIDDLLDSAQDGRPIMSKRQMLGLFFQAAVLYNLPFYKQNHALLFPIILDITNLYAISVEWEVSPKPHLRAMADVFRTSGNRMYSMIALICGGPDHMYDISKHIHDRDWCLQHDKDGNPT